jgi:hypothetical protein
MNKKLVGRPKEYTDKMIKRNLRLPEYIWQWLDNLDENRTKALIKLYEKNTNLK